MHWSEFLDIEDAEVAIAEIWLSAERGGLPAPEMEMQFDSSGSRVRIRLRLPPVVVGLRVPLERFCTADQGSNRAPDSRLTGTH